MSCESRWLLPANERDAADAFLQISPTLLEMHKLEVDTDLPREAWDDAITVALYFMDLAESFTTFDRAETISRSARIHVFDSRCGLVAIVDSDRDHRNNPKFLSESLFKKQPVTVSEGLLREPGSDESKGMASCRQDVGNVDQRY